MLVHERLNSSLFMDIYIYCCNTTLGMHRALTSRFIPGFDACLHCKKKGLLFYFFLQCSTLFFVNGTIYCFIRLYIDRENVMTQK